MRRCACLLVLALAAITLVLGGCSGDDADDDDAGDTDRSAPDDGEEADGVEVSDEFCVASAGYLSVSGNLADDSLDDLDAGAARVQEALGNAALDAPDQLAEDFAILDAAIDELVAAVDDAESVEAAKTAAAELVEGEVAAAADRVDEVYQAGYAEETTTTTTAGG